MNKTYAFLLAAALAFGAAAPVSAQTFADPDPVLHRIWDEAVNRSQLEPLAQALLDSIGPRLTGTPGMERAQNWALGMYNRWGIEARNEPYGTWTGWDRGISHIDLVEPRVRSLEGMNLAWSPATNGPVTGEAVVLPAFRSAAEFQAWLPNVSGRYVMISPPQATCRPDENWVEFGLPESVERMRAQRAEIAREWNARIQATGFSATELPQRLEAAGAAGVVTSLWAGGWGVTRIFNARTRQVPTFELSCEDYGLVFRLAQNNQGPVLRVNLEAEFMGEVPVSNTIAVIPGRELPNEYVMLSAHFDSWDGSSGATDNGSGTVLMMEVMRILRQAYPNPRRTILVGHWNGEEQGLNGSRAFVEDNPQVVEGLQALFNQDNGTGRVVNISMQGFIEAGEHFGRWLARVPSEVTRHIELTIPGTPGAGGTDHASFVCAGAPAFNLSALNWDYFTYTWHTNRDTFDKLVFDDIRNNAVLIASLVYLASEDPERVSRARRTVFPVNPRTGEQTGWPECRPAARSADVSPRM
jgi:carboxypeptidase Q